MFVGSFGREIKEPNDIIWVHMTDYYPDGGKIRSRYDATRDFPRMTVHGSLNHAVSGHTYGNWDDKKYLIASPFGDLVGKNSNPENLISVDTFFFGCLDLTTTAIVLVEDRSKFSEDRKIKDSADSTQHRESAKHLRQMVCYGPPRESDKDIMDIFGAKYIEGGMWGWKGTLLTSADQEEVMLTKLRERLGLDGGAHGESIYERFENAVNCIRLYPNTERGYWNGVNRLLKIKPDLPKKEMRDFAERVLAGIRFPEGSVQIYSIDVDELAASGFIPKGSLVTVTD